MNGDAALPKQGLNTIVRTILFWMFMIVLAVFVWRMASGSSGPRMQAEPSYSEFLELLGKDGVLDATIWTSNEGAEIQRRLREQEREYKVEMARELIPEVTKSLRDKNVPLRFRAATTANWMAALVNLLPLLLVLALWIFMIRQMQARSKQ
jgi:cell division protease FtsH